MKFNCSIVIDLPKEKLVSLWQDESRFPHWQKGFKSKQLIQGNKGEKDAVSEIVLDFKGKDMILKETVVENQLPDYKKVYVAHKHMCNFLTDQFESKGEHQTVWTAEVEYTQFIGFLPKLMAKFFPSMFKKQVQKWLDDFKHYAEGLDTKDS
tara:strand:+ start:1191 stop:1646 length:456 start_codon:yes stop_codon:yes gene_type:complete